MASLFLRPFLRPLPLSICVAFSLATLHLERRRPLRLDSGPISPNPNYPRAPQSSPPQDRMLRPNPITIRQISSGSLLGLCAGLTVSALSRPLALLIGLLVIGMQWAESYGIDILPYNMLQNYVTNMDLRYLIRDNVAFKLSFGTTFAAAAFLRF